MGMNGKKVAVIGAGPGGLAAAMLLGAQGYEVEVFEKQPYLGGRTSELTIGDFRFDRGPTFLNMPGILEELFDSAGRRLEDYIQLKELTPMYKLRFGELELSMSRNREEMEEEIERAFPGEGAGYRRYMKEQAAKLDALLPILRNKFDSPLDYLSPKFLRAIPKLTVTQSLYECLSQYFKDERLKLAFTFQSKYLGMSPWDCPGAFTILSYMEHAYGVFHPIGGVNRITEAMAQVVREYGGVIHLNCGVRRILSNDKRFVGLELENGERIGADEVVVNADFAYMASHLLEDGTRGRYSKPRLPRKSYSCSTYMIYAAVNRRYEERAHHTISFAQDYRENVEDITRRKLLSRDPSVYIHNPCVTDPGLAPEGKSSIYLLAPVPNQTSAIPWGRVKDSFRDRVLRKAEEAGFEGLSASILEERVITPEDWEQGHYIYHGATFSLAHNLQQMMYLRPHNRFKELEGCWLTGGGTHPGSGLPTIIESARITVREMLRAHGREAVI